jgi:exopolysaccharide biosynthesis polyprenyl glycosylphosphotransferase
MTLSPVDTETKEALPAEEKRNTEEIVDFVHRTQNPWTGWRMLLSDAMLICLSFFLAYYLRYTVQLFEPVDEINEASFSPYIPYMLIFLGWILIAGQNANLYNYRRGRSWANEMFAIGNAAANAGIVIMAISFLLRPLVFSRLLIVQAVVLTIVILGAWRFVVREISRRLRKRGIGVERVLVIGASDTGLNVLRTLVARPDLGYRVVGFVDDDPERSSQDLGRVPALGTINNRNLRHIFQYEEIDLAIVTLPWTRHAEIMEITSQCERYGVQVRSVPDLFQLNISQVQIETLGGIPLLGMKREATLNRTNRIIKRSLDLFLILASAPVWLPFVSLVAVAIRLDTKGPVFFTQERIGLNGKPFKMIKFRSMVTNAEERWQEVLRQSNEIYDPRLPKIKHDPRITRVGHFLRRTSLDELPNIFNVLKGDMSLVGPRAQVPQEVALYSTWHFQRLRVLPGMTGLWQVSGRSNVPFDEMCLLDIYYIENWSLGMDLQILLQTAPKVIFGIGAY